MTKQEILKQQKAKIKELEIQLKGAKDLLKYIKETLK